MNNQLQQVRLFELGDRLLQSWWTLVAGLALGTAAALLTMQLVPRTYKANALLGLRSERLTRAYQVPTTVGSDIRTLLDSISSTVSSEESLAAIAEKEFGSTDGAGDRKEQISGMRSRIRTRFSERTGELLVGFEDGDARRAARVANALAARYVEEYRHLRLGLARENTTVLKTLLDATRSDLEAKLEEIASFKREHAEVLAMTTNQTQLEELRKELAAKREERAEAADRIRAIRDAEELREAMELMPPTGTLSESGSSSQQIAELRQQLKELRFRYSDSHPDIESILRRIEELENAPPEESESTPPGPAAADLDPLKGYVQVEQRLLDRLALEEREIQAKIRRLEGLVARAEVVQQELDDLSLGREVLERNYNDAHQRVELARTAELGEENQISGEFAIRERAGVPALPVSPKPLIVFGVGILGGLFLFVGPLVARWFLFPVVGSESALRAFSDIPILVAVPRMLTSDTARLVRRRRIKNVGLSVLSASVLAASLAFGWLGLG